MSSGEGIVLVLIAALLIAGVVYWQLVVAEGAYLGTRVVSLLYDWFAPRYDRVKQYDKTADAIMLAQPVMRHLTTPHPHGPSESHLPLSRRERGEGNVLDVGTGTGRMPDALLSQARFKGHVVAIDASVRMLDLAREKLARHASRITFMQRDAQSLPFEDASFDVVTCLEVLEFMGDGRGALREMVRVLKPGGLLMVSNRIGSDAWKLPGRALKTGDFVTWLSEIGVSDARSQAWLVDYDLVIGTKAFLTE